MALPAKSNAVVIEVNCTTQARIVFEIKIIDVFIKLNWATAIALRPFESRPAIEKKIGARADEPRPANKNPKNAKAKAICLLLSTISVEEINIEVKPTPPSTPPVLIQNRSLAWFRAQPIE